MEAARTHGVEASLLKEAEVKTGLVERVQAEAELRDAMRGGDLLVLQRALAVAKKRCPWPRNAQDNAPAQEGFGVGDTLSIVFDKDTNEPSLATKAELLRQLIS